jgi:hypothetical protein
MFPSRYFTVGSVLLLLGCTAQLGHAQEPVVKPAVILPTTGRAPWIGFEVVRVDDVVRAQLPKLPKGVGFVISNVIANGPARQAGVMPFDILWRWNDQFLVNEAQLAVLLQMHKPGEEIALTIFRAGEEKSLNVTLAPEPDPRAVAAGPTLDSVKTPTMVPALEITRPQDVNAVLEMQSREDGMWLTITDADGNSVFDGAYAANAMEKTIPAVWHDRINALHQTLMNRISSKPAEAPKEIVPVVPVSNPR